MPFGSINPTHPRTNLEESCIRTNMHRTVLIAYIRISFLIWCSNENLYWTNQNKRQILWKKSWFPDTRFGCFNRIDFNLLYDYQVREGEKSLPYQNQTKVDRSMAVQRRKYFRPSGNYRDSWDHLRIVPTRFEPEKLSNSFKYFDLNWVKPDNYHMKKIFENFWVSQRCQETPLNLGFFYHF